MGRSSDALGLEITAGEGITLLSAAERAVTGPSVEGEVAVAAEGAEAEGAPVEAGGLLGITCVVGVARAGERRGIRPALVRLARDLSSHG